MAIINRKVGSLDTIFGNIQNNTDPIFIILARDSLVGVHSIGLNISVLFVTHLGRIQCIFRILTIKITTSWTRDELLIICSVCIPCWLVKELGLMT